MPRAAARDRVSSDVMTVEANARFLQEPVHLRLLLCTDPVVAFEIEPGLLKIGSESFFSLAPHRLHPSQHRLAELRICTRLLVACRDCRLDLRFRELRHGR